MVWEFDSFEKDDHNNNLIIFSLVKIISLSQAQLEWGSAAENELINLKLLDMIDSKPYFLPTIQINIDSIKTYF